MSSYLAMTRRPETGEFEPAYWIDAHHGPRHYAVRFMAGSWYDPEKVELVTLRNERYNMAWC